MRLGRLSVWFDWTALPRPRVSYENQGPDYHYVALIVGTTYSDPVFSVELNLGDKRP